MNINNKVNAILKKFNDPNEFKEYGINKKYNAKLWNMDTSILTILQQMHLKISNIEIPIKRIEIRKIGINKNGNSEFSIFVDETNITPSRIKNNISYSAVRQYLQVLSSLGIVMFGTTKNKQIEGFYDVSANFKSTISYDYDSEIIKRLIAFCLKRNIEYSRNLAFSIFYSVLKFYEFDFANIDLSNLKIEKKMSKDNIKYFNPCTSYGQNYINKCYKETYGKLIEHTLQSEEMDEFISSLINIIEENDNYNDFFSSNEEIASQIELGNCLNNLRKGRSKFKECIQKNREELNLFNPNKNLYSDILTIDNEIDGLACKFNELDAAHIYNVWQIKSEVIKKCIEGKSDDVMKLIENVENPYNGLMMNNLYHKYFDRNYFTFNVDGEMIYRKEDKEYLFNTLRMQEVKINPKILNNEMKEFLRQRKF